MVEINFKKLGLASGSHNWLVYDLTHWNVLYEVKVVKLGKREV